MDESPKQVRLDRLNELENFTKLVEQFTDLNRKEFENAKEKWKQDLFSSNLSELRKLKIEIKEYSEESNLERFVKYYIEKNSPFFGEFIRKSGISYQYEILRYSPYFSFYQDIIWMPEAPFTVGDGIKIATGEKNLDFLKEYLPEKIEKVEVELIPLIKQLNIQTEFIDLVCDALEFSTCNKFTVSNLLIFPIIEGIVTQSLRKIYFNQNPATNTSTLEENFNRRNSLADKILWNKWKTDLEVNIFDLWAKYSYVQNKTMFEINERVRKHSRIPNKLYNIVTESSLLNLKNFEDLDKMDKEELIKKIRNSQIEFENLKKDEIPKDEIVKIGINTEFYFLCKKVREDRNNILHGNLQGFNQPYQNFIFLSALEKSVKSIHKYKKIYPDL